MIEVKHRYTGEVLHTVEADTLEGANLSGANLRGADLSDVDLSNADLSNADLSNAYLNGAHLNGANLSNVRLFDAHLFGTQLFDADLRKAHLFGVDLRKAILYRANLNDARLSGADLRKAYLISADLNGADLSNANLSGANLLGANLTDAHVGETIFIDCPTLHQAKGLDVVRHGETSNLDARTLRACVNYLPDVFLRGIGYNQEEVEYLRAMYTGGGIKYYSCFIAYRHDDHDFAKYLHDQLEAAGVTCWLDERDMQGGKYERPQIQVAIKAHDKLLLICSEEMVTRPRVVEEIIAALQAQREGTGQKLFPVRLDDYICGKDVLAVADAKLSKGEWSEDWVRAVQTYHIPDFEQWKDHHKFQEQFQRLLRDLKNKPDA